MYKRQGLFVAPSAISADICHRHAVKRLGSIETVTDELYVCLLYTSDAADERSSVDLGGRRIIKKKI